MTVKPYTCDNGATGAIWLLPSIVVSTGPEEFKTRRRVFDIAFHWITFGFGLCFEWGRK